MLHTTFALARRGGACEESYRAVAKALGGSGKYGKETPIPLSRIVELRGLSDALWCLRCVLPEEEVRRDRLSRELACDYAEHIAHLWQAPAGVAWQPNDTIKVVRAYVKGEATETELTAARATAWAAGTAAKATAKAAGAAVETAAWAAWVAAWAAGAAARATARAAGAVTGEVAGEVARAAEESWQTERFIAMLQKEG